MSKKKPITRVDKFFSEEDFNLEQEFGREFVEGDLNLTVVLFRIDKKRTNVDDLYGEAYTDEMRFFPPVELKVILTLDTPENKSYNNNGSMRYLEHGRLTFGIYQNQLEELNVDVSYGDYIGYQETETKMKYFVVVNDGLINSDNTHTILGYKGFYRTIVCSPVSEDEFNAK